MVMWDNRATMHRGRPWPAHEARLMVRTTISATAADGVEAHAPAVAAGGGVVEPLVDEGQRPRHRLQRLALGGDAPAPGDQAGQRSSARRRADSREHARARAGVDQRAEQPGPTMPPMPVPTA